MKKTFPLHDPRKADARVLDAIKHEVRKYVQRELKKAHPDGAKRRTFACFVGPNQTEVHEATLKDVSTAIDRVAQAGGDQVFIEIKSAPAEESAR
jgi:hypothetical protein